MNHASDDLKTQTFEILVLILTKYMEMLTTFQWLTSANYGITIREQNLVMKNLEIVRGRAYLPIHE